MKRVLYAGAVGAMAVAAAAGAAFADPMAPNDVKIVDGEVKASLTGKPGDAAKGREVFANRKLGNCLACHQNPDMAKDEQFHGEVAPSLGGVAERYSPEQLRAIVVNPKAALSDKTLMPAFYRVSGLNHVAKKFKDKTILSAEQVEDVVAYLQTLK